MKSGPKTTARTFAHGVHPPESKGTGMDAAPQRIPLAPSLIIPLAQHTGAPARALVRAKQEVRRGEMIAEPAAFVSVAHHAPTTGTIEKVGLAVTPNGTMAQAIYLRPNPDASQMETEGVPCDPETLQGDDLVNAVQRAGLVGLGGAAFPTHVKLVVPPNKIIDAVLVNGCECEPVLTTDHRLMLDRAEDLFAGIRLALRATKAQRAIIGIEDNKPDAVQKLRRSVPAGLNVEVVALPVKYPQGAEKMLIKALLRREVPSGGLPADAGAAVFNVATLAEMGGLIPRGQGLIERSVTVAGSGVERPGNYIIPIGTPLWFVLEQTGRREGIRQVILGGPMMGQSVASLNVPVTKGVSGILALTETDLAQAPILPESCIRCGRCLQACPMSLNPSRMGLFARKAEYARMAQELHLNDCFECGCCAFVCPSRIPLVQYFRAAKAVNRARKASS